MPRRSPTPPTQPPVDAADAARRHAAAKPVTTRAALLALLLATVCTGLMTGFALTYQIAVAPGLERTGAAAWAETYHRIDHALDANVFFWFGIFVGALAFAAAALIAVARLRVRAALPWLAVATVGYRATVLITGLLIDPVEADVADAYRRIDTIGAGGVRAAFDESRWSQLNVIRLATSAVAFLALTWSLVLVGRATAPAANPGAGDFADAGRAV